MPTIRPANGPAASSRRGRRPTVTPPTRRARWARPCPTRSNRPPRRRLRPPPRPPPMHLDNPILLLLAQIGLILLLSRVMGWVFSKLQQPQVMGEMVAGIMLGPSLFGLLAPDFQAALFPPQSVPYLNVLSQVGVIFFLFLIGLELDPKLLSNRGHAAVVISHVSIIAPFLLGGALALLLYTRL